MLNNRQDASDDAELARLVQKKRKYQVEREVLELRIEELDHNIIETQAEYGAIYNKRAPLLKLPTEVTCMIFDFAAGYPMEGDSEEGRHLLPEVVVSHVCRQWRSTSLAYPQLWASFCYDGPQAIRPPLERLEAYLERSALQPLELWLNFREAADDSELLADNLALLEKTISHIARWKRVTLFSDSHTPLEGLIPKIYAVSAPNLEHFAFCCDQSPSQRHEFQSNDALEPTIFTNGAPKLTSVLLDCSSIEVLPPLSNVTTLRLEGPANTSVYPISWSTFLVILFLPSLANLSLVGDIFELPDNHTTVGLITMNNLTHFRYGDSEGLALLLPYFRAPLLETLTLQNDWLPEEFGVNAELYTFPSLYSVSLIDTTAASPQIAGHFARMTEAATELLLSQDEYDETLFATLQHTSIPTVYWPKVKLLTFNSPLETHTYGPHLLEFAKAHSKNDLVIRVFGVLDEHWSQTDPVTYNAIKEVCAIETMDTEDNPLAEYANWPPGGYDPGYLHDDDDPFDINLYSHLPGIAAV